MIILSAESLGKLFVTKHQQLAFKAYMTQLDISSVVLESAEGRPARQQGLA